MKQIIVLMNEESLEIQNVESPVKREMSRKYFLVSPTGKYTYPVVIRPSKIDLDDSLFAVGSLLKENQNSFELIWKQFEPSLGKSKMTTHVDVFLDMDFYTYTRTTYNLLDFLRDIGGLFGSVNAISGALVFALNYNGLYQVLTSRLFRIASTENEQGSNNASLIASKFGFRNKKFSKS